MRSFYFFVFLASFWPLITSGQALRITEFMADPNPVVGLPDAEYVEIYNPADTAMEISTLGIASGGRAVYAGAGEEALAAGAYLVLVPEADAAAFSSLPVRTLPLSLPGLTNGGDEIVLLLGTDTLFKLTYTSDWYHDPNRDGGGYSLAYTGSGDPDCGGNWRASMDPTGGTPGRPNSVLGMRADSIPPQLTASLIDSSGITLAFSEPIATPLYATLDGAPMELKEGNDGEYFIPLSPVSGRVYRLVIAADFADCAGNYTEADLEVPLLLPETPAPGALRLNEVLFNPVADGSDFVELYNNGLKTINLGGLMISNDRSSSRPRPIETTYLLEPGDYVVLTPSPEDIAARFPAVERDRLIALALPPLPNEAGNVTVSTADGIVLDALDYHEALHAGLLNTPEGVSLERLDPSVDTDAPGNWASAAGDTGFGTPTRINSRHLAKLQDGVRYRLEVPVKVFSPDGEGFEDEFVLHYNGEGVGGLAASSIFNLDGQPIAVDRPTVSLGREGELRWDGRDDAGHIVPAGPYLLLLEIFSPAGDTRREKIVAVVAPSR